MSSQFRLTPFLFPRFDLTARPRKAVLSRPAPGSTSSYVVSASPRRGRAGRTRGCRSASSRGPSAASAERKYHHGAGAMSSLRPRHSRTSARVRGVRARRSTQRSLRGGRFAFGLVSFQGAAGLLRTFVRYGIDFDISAESDVTGRVDAGIDGTNAAADAQAAAKTMLFICDSPTIHAPQHTPGMEQSRFAGQFEFRKRRDKGR